MTTEAKNFCCPECGEKYHVKFDGREYSCRQCGKSFRVPKDNFEHTEKKKESIFTKQIDGRAVLGPLLLLLGGIGVLYFMLYFDVSVEVPSQIILGQEIGGGRVNNIGLMQDKQNGIIISGLVFVVGLIVMFLKNSSTQKEKK